MPFFFAPEEGLPDTLRFRDKLLVPHLPKIKKPHHQKVKGHFCSPCVTQSITKNREFVDKIDHFPSSIGNVVTQLVKILA